MDYENVYDTFINKGCNLITNKEEYFELKKMSKIPKLNYIASCGHSNSVHYNVFTPFNISNADFYGIKKLNYILMK
jgi:hypothetical protein